MTPDRPDRQVQPARRVRRVLPAQQDPSDQLDLRVIQDRPDLLVIPVLSDQLALLDLPALKGILALPALHQRYPVRPALRAIRAQPVPRETRARRAPSGLPALPGRKAILDQQGRHRL